MATVISIDDSDQLIIHTDSDCYKNFDVEWLKLHEADHHCVCMDEQKLAHARCSLWWKSVPSYQDKRLGVIGHFYSDTASATEQLLTYACNYLRQIGCTLAVGPMDGNTWRHYRFISKRSNQPSFFLEPENQSSWPVEFKANGFVALANYSSALTHDLSREDERLAEIRLRLKAQGVTLRSLDMAQFENELDRIYVLSIMSFQDNFLYTPIHRGEFIQMYAKVKPYVQPELTLLAELEGKLIGYLFGIPDLLQKQSGQAIDTFIIKTVAVDPHHRGDGLGALLVADAQQRAYTLGYRNAIHALMHETNNSKNISEHYAKTIRRYSIYSKDL